MVFLDDKDGKKQALQFLEKGRLLGEDASLATQHLLLHCTATANSPGNQSSSTSLEAKANHLQPLPRQEQDGNINTVQVPVAVWVPSRYALQQPGYGTHTRLHS